MELSEGPEDDIRHTVREHLEDLEHRLTGKLTEKLEEREHPYLSLEDVNAWANSMVHLQAKRSTQLKRATIYNRLMLCEQKQQEPRN